MALTIRKIMLIVLSSLLLASMVSCIDEDTESSRSESGSNDQLASDDTVFSGSYYSSSPETTSCNETVSDPVSQASVQPVSDPSSASAVSSEISYEGSTSGDYQNIIDDLDELEDVINELDDLTSDVFVIPEP